MARGTVAQFRHPPRHILLSADSKTQATARGRQRGQAPERVGGGGAGYPHEVRIVITGATGNVGSSLIASLSADPDVSAIQGLARRLPAGEPATESRKVEWSAADIAGTELEPLFDSADVVVHLAWVIQPSRNLGVQWRTNVLGSWRVFEAAGKAGVGAVVCASSVGAYSPGPKDHPVDESWPTMGIYSSVYSRQKAEVERLLDLFEYRYPGVRTVRLRPSLIFKREAASEIRRLFLGPFFPNPLASKAAIPVVPDVPGLRFQTVHTEDIAEAYRLAIKSGASGAFNIASDPVLDPRVLARHLKARTVPVQPQLVRALVTATWRLHLQPTPPGWVDMALSTPLMDTTRAREELGWKPARSSLDALDDLMAGLRSGSGSGTPPLEAGGKGFLRLSEFARGIGRRSI